MTQQPPLTDAELIKRLHEADVPEPSPLFWQHLSLRVHDAVAAEPVPSTAWRRPFSLLWAGTFVAAAAAVLLVIGISFQHASQEPERTTAVEAGYSDARQASIELPRVEDDESLAVMGELVSEMELDEAGIAGLPVAPGTAEAAANQMTTEEQQSVLQFLEREIGSSKSL
jgi:hypothetical protein